MTSLQLPGQPVAKCPCPQEPAGLGGDPRRVLLRRSSSLGSCLQGALLCPWKQLIWAESSVCRQKIALSMGRALKAVKTVSFPLCCGGYAGVVTPEVAGESKSTQSLSKSEYFVLSSASGYKLGYLGT